MPSPILLIAVSVSFSIANPKVSQVLRPSLLPALKSLKSLSLVAMGISTVDTAGVAAAHTPQPSLERP